MRIPKIHIPTFLRNPYAWVAILSFLAIGNYFAWSFGTAELGKFVYHFDTSNYWIALMRLSSLAVENPWEAITSIAHSIRFNDYNNFVLVPLIPFSILFGSERTVFLLLLTNVLLLPSFVVFLGIVGRALDETDRSFTVPLAALLAFLPATFIWVPVTNGAPDVWGLFFAGLITYALCKKPVEEMTWKKTVLMSVLLFLLLITRRWFLIWIIGFFVAQGVDLLYSFYLSRSWEKALRYALKLSLLGISFALLVFTAMTPFITRVLGTNYSEAYEAFQVSNPTLVSKFLKFVNPIGMVIFLIAACGIALLIADKKTRRFGIFVAVQSVSTYFIFTDIQGFSSAHFYLLALPLVLGLAVAIAKCMAWMRSWWLRSVALLVFGALFFLNFKYVFDPEWSAFVKAIPYRTSVFSKTVSYPRTRNDLQELLKINEELAKTIRPTDKIYVLSASDSLNYLILKNLHYTLPEAKDLSPNILNSQNIDVRDGFPANIFKASYIVIGNPAVLTRPETQQIMVLPAELITSGALFGDAFDKIGQTYELKNNVEISIYKKTGTIRERDVEILADELATHYPDNEFINTPPSSFKLPD